MDQKRVYTFGNGHAEGKADMRNLLGGKGANLAEMNLIGVPVPPGFTITTEVCTEYNEKGRESVVALLKDDVEKSIAHIESLMNSKFGDVENPLLVSVRSGARASMPGMMDTILNLGLNDEVVAGLARKTNNERFAWDSYRRFVQMYGDVVLGMKPTNKDDIDPFEAIIEDVKHAKGVKLDNELDVNDLKELVKRFKVAVKERTGQDFPTNAYEQLWGAVCAVFNSWMNERAILYRKMEGIPDEWGTAVNVQAMVFGNMGDTSATGVCFSRDAATGEDLFNGEYLINAQGEDVVAGIRTPQQITKIGSQRWAQLQGISEEERASKYPSMEEAMPEIYKQLDELQTKLENHYHDMQDMEFTVQEGKLWFLQTRNGKRTGAAMVRIAMEMLEQGLIDEKTAIKRCEPNKLDELLHPVFDKEELRKAKVLTRGLPASPGAACGQIVFFADDAAKWRADGHRVVMVRIETSPEDLAGIPDSIRALAADKARDKGVDGWIFTLDGPMYVPFMRYAANRELRRRMYFAYNTISAKGDELDNKETVRRIANLRRKVAGMLGYGTFADYVLANRMAECSANVYSMLGQLTDNYMPLAQDEHGRVKALARETDGLDDVMPWDWSYYSEKLRKREYDLDEEEVKEYFELGSVIRGVFGLATRLYGLTFKENAAIPVYAPDVKAFEVFDGDGRFMAVLYTDFHPRATKQSGAWMTEYRSQWRDVAGDHRPHVSLVMNFNPPTEGKPSLLTHDEVNTFLHEFGHALHGMLSDVTYRSISGTSVYRDFVELPSQFMENYGTESGFLDTFARNYRTDEPMPESLVAKIKKAENFNVGYACTRQISFAALDMAWHDRHEDFTGDVEQYEKQVFARYVVLPQVEGTMMSTQFGHIFSGGYAAGYYGYKWAEILDADAFSKFKENGIFDRATAQSFRDNILSRGGAEHPMALYVKFRGRKPTVDALLKRNGIK